MDPTQGPKSGNRIPAPSLTSMPQAAPQLLWSHNKGSHCWVLSRDVIIGSAEGADIVVNAPDVSRLHAALDFEPDGVWIRDLGSAQGTYLDTVRVRSARLTNDALIRLGSAELRFTYDQHKNDIPLWPDEHFGPLVGRSTVMRALFARLHRVARLDSTVLIYGETGTGKELVARALHEASPRADKPFVVVDCGALTESLLEAELFGHTKNAFTGAGTARSGAIEAADTGTVFLDEIGELPLSMQPKLLRAIEGRMVRRVGETNYRPVNVRFVAATHRDLPAMINAGNFREDLYFRLNVLPVSVPPLRARPEDIPLLAERLLPDGVGDSLTPELLREIHRRAWPGNVRELRNFVERAVAFGMQEALALGNERQHSESAPPSGVPSGFPPISTDEAFKEVRDRWLEHLAREYMRAMVAKYNRDTNAIAQAAGLDRSYVYRLIRKLEL
jgi:transcriptional regulator with GAF, ATPase, and Fis domain